ncbi:hypothetical protein SKAU_G00202700 [Synaphobranchus kaupii]|uniref:GYF domain-containing protein n=1 Tax=Synaphobranchus kaupii TaxID=118154 RepID=A0A9Q1IY01_SYNKA|nr:hypothetical protein SKAU_G00202700 [Synaphobranchus kaupii]
MAETQTLNFGPEWLRALSSGGSGSSIASPPLSPALPKYKLADYRYGREEMLALYVKDNKIPLDLHDKEFLPILQDEPLPPLALVPFTEEEQRNFSMSVNSAAVLRLTGRGMGTVAGAPRGRSSSRGRGRGRGEVGFYQRSFDDVEGGFGRGGREIHRSQSWEERGDKRFEKPGRKDPDVAAAHFQLNHIRANYEEGGPAPGRKHEFTRSESENWRRRRFPFDGREEDRGYRRAQEDERDSLPEWCLEDAEEETGTFDSSGAFLSLKVRGAELSGLPQIKKAPKEPILEEAELDFRPSEDCEAYIDPDETKETDTPAGKEADSGKAKEEAAPPPSPPPCPAELQRPTPSPPHQPEREQETPPAPEVWPKAPAPALNPQQRLPPDTPKLLPGPLPFPAGIMAPIGQPEALSHDTDDDEGLKHFEQEAEKMVAYLQEDDKLSAPGLEPAKPAALPLSHDAALKWFYKDPQGEIQGPFSNQEMMEWFQAGYFTMTLLVKRGCDELFQPLGEIIKMWGRVPFTPGPSPSPLLGDVDQERLKRQQELTALNLYQLQQLQYQYMLRQQYAQALAQQQKAAALGAPPQQQQQQHLNLLLQQYQALKMRTSEQSLVPPVTRSMSVPDSGSVWELQNASSSQASASSNVPHAARNAWEGGSVWDLPGDSMAQAPTLEQIQQLEKAKAAAAKLEQERREAELRAKREEEERKRREEALLAQQEEECKRREEEELARRQQEEALRLQQEQEEALRRQKEEEEEEARRLQERKRREEEERRQREELLRKQEEERRKQEELEALRRLEEEKRLEEEARLQQQEEQKRREQELQRQRQQEALRRLQQQQQQQQLAQMKLPSSSKWGQQATNSLPLCQAQNALSLAEIQKLEEERERQTLEERRLQQQELMRVIHQQQQHQQQAQAQSQAQARLPGWGSASRQPSSTPKSLLEIQREEAQQMKQRKEPQQPGDRTTQQSRTSSSSHSVWGSVSSGGPQWASDAAGIWSGSAADASNANLGFWDEAVKEAVTTPLPKSTAKKNKSNANLSQPSSGRANKKAAEEEEKLLKLFQGVNQTQDGFTQWCEQSLHALNAANNLDVPTFTCFLKEVESPYEVDDYVRGYLGDTPESKEFAKHFLERRATAKQNDNHQKAQPQPQPVLQAPQPKPQQRQQQSDSVWGGSQSIFQSNHSTLQQARFETVTSGKKKKKQKMVRADPSLLGFSVNASSERLNMGEIETVEDF